MSTPEELEKMFTEKPADGPALSSGLKSNGYEITRTASDGIYARAKASQIANSLEVNMVPVTKDGVTYTAAQNVPSLPAEVGVGVRSMNGLQPFRQANKHLRFVEAPSARTPSTSPSPAIANAPPYLVSEILHAYNAQRLGVTAQDRRSRS